jgi:hypothetical protein
LKNHKPPALKRVLGAFLFSVFYFFKWRNSMKCPKCASERVLQKNQAKKTGGLLGSIAAASGLMGAVELGEIGLILAPLGGAVGVVSSAVLGGIAGANLGRLIDRQILDNNLCDDCGHCFSDEDSHP